jgi:uncharacterized protein YuzE
MVATCMAQVGKETDSLYIRLRSGSYSESEEVKPGIVFDFDADGKLMAVDIEHAR